MKLEKAIEIVILNLDEAGSKMPPDCRDALKLLVKAAESVLYTRITMPDVLPNQLPGETKD